MPKELRKSSNCLNCETETFLNDYCPKCGQLNTDRRVSVKTLFQDFMGDYFTFDSKLFKSIIPLILKPGHLTNEYNNGKRVRYILPLRLYIFMSILFFFMMSLQENIQMDEDLRKETQKTLIQKYKQQKKLVETDSAKQAIDVKINEIKKRPLDTFNVNQLVKFKFEKDSIKQLVKKKKHEKNEQKKSRVDTTSWEYKFERLMEKQAEKISEKDDPQEFVIQQFIGNGPKALFVLMPIFAFLLKLLYFRRKKFYIEHFIFSLHTHTLFFIYLTIANLSDNSIVTGFMALACFISLFFSMKNVYGQHWFKTLMKMGLLFVVYSIVCIIALALLALYIIIFTV